eukprot:CAMPEP_0168525234 /NCGR_PEP_ID=MMETSP0405-20121227/11172_1 /TAXON_ID=498012 /ORGANISM="Trichosphaerium sp, Strain Am-I-7 wt" /LENGTH=120 /DNA_ID=CAMNT_0008547689 /DNA_START=415 /DNA_END=777 /DNA_ORIENTATION=+
MSVTIDRENTTISEILSNFLECRVPFKSRNTSRSALCVVCLTSLSASVKGPLNPSGSPEGVGVANGVGVDVPEGVGVDVVEGVGVDVVEGVGVDVTLPGSQSVHLDPANGSPFPKLPAGL